MKTRALWMATLVMVALMFFGTSNAMAGWHELTQAQRDQLIINEAYEDDNNLVGVSCKEWVRDVIERASGNLVTIPATVDPPGSYWYYSSNVVAATTYLYSVQPGQILQMRLSSGVPHTAIVVDRGLYGLTLIESNWDGTPYVYSDAYVRDRYVTYTTFNSQVSYFTAYNIL